jgi:hypothetical protein
LKIFAICHRCQRHRWCTLSFEYLREFSKKFETALLVNSGAWGKLIHEKKQKSKISWHCPFNPKIFAKLSEIWVGDPRSGIRKKLNPIQSFKKATDPRSVTLGVPYLCWPSTALFIYGKVWTLLSSSGSHSPNEDLTYNLVLVIVYLFF